MSKSKLVQSPIDAFSHKQKKSRASLAATECIDHMFHHAFNALPSHVLWPSYFGNGYQFCKGNNSLVFQVRRNLGLVNQDFGIYARNGFFTEKHGMALSAFDHLKVVSCSVFVSIFFVNIHTVCFIGAVQN